MRLYQCIVYQSSDRQIVAGQKTREDKKNTREQKNTRGLAPRFTRGPADITRDFQKTHIFKKPTFSKNPHFQKTHIFKKPTFSKNPHFQKTHIFKKPTFLQNPSF